MWNARRVKLGKLVALVQVHVLHVILGIFLTMKQVIYVNLVLKVNIKKTFNPVLVHNVNWAAKKWLAPVQLQKTMLARFVAPESTKIKLVY